MALTELEIQHLKPKDKTYRMADEKGLAIEVRTNGSKFWRLRYRHNGKQLMMGLGQYPKVTLAQARKKRDEAKDGLAEGKDPIREKKLEKIRNVTDGDNTFEAIARKWMEIQKTGLNEKYTTQQLARLEQLVVI